jgi:quinol monooxygenase YgiN
MSEIEIVRIPVADENHAALVSLLEDARSGFLAPPLCTRLEILRGEGEAIAIIRWQSSAAHKEAAAGPHGRPLNEAIGRLAAGAPQIQAFPVTVSS